MKIARIFQILAVILLGIAAYFLWLGNRDGIFVSLVLSGCAYFLSLRFQIRERLKEHTAQTEPPAEIEEAQTDVETETENAQTVRQPAASR